MSIEQKVTVDLSKNPKQFEYYLEVMKACNGVSNKRKFAYGGAIRGGKTFVTLFIITQLCEKYPRSRWLVIRESFPAIQKTTVESFHKIIAGSDNWKWRLDRGNYYAENKKGSRVYFMAENITQDPQLNAFLGIEVNGIFLEQLEELSKEMWDMSISRSGSWYVDPMPPAFIFTTFNPTQRWAKQFLYERWRKNELPDDFFYMTALPSDNAFVTQDQYNAWETMDERRKKTLVEGDWTDFDDTDPRWAFAFDNRHIKPVLPFLPTFPVYLGWDFNRDPLSCVAAQFSPNIGHRGSFLHWIGEFSEPVQLRELCMMIKARFPRNTLYVTGDSSGNKGDIGYERKNDTHYRMIQRYLNLSDRQMNLNKINLEHNDSRLLTNTMLSSYPNEFFAEKLQMPDGTLVDGVPRLIEEYKNAKVDSDHHKAGHLLKDRNAFKLDLFDASRYVRQTYFKRWLDLVGWTR